MQRTIGLRIQSFTLVLLLFYLFFIVYILLQIIVIDKVDGKTNGSIRKLKKCAVARPSTAGSEELKKQRDAQRKQMMEDRRKAMKSQKQPSQSIEIFVPESS